MFLRRIFLRLVACSGLLKCMVWGPDDTIICSVQVPTNYKSIIDVCAKMSVKSSDRVFRRDTSSSSPIRFGCSWLALSRSWTDVRVFSFWWRVCRWLAVSKGVRCATSVAQLVKTTCSIPCSSTANELRRAAITRTGPKLQSTRIL